MNPRKTHDDCNETCNEHSGLKTLMYLVLTLVVVNGIMLTYQIFVQTKNIEIAVVEMRGEITGIKKDLADHDRRLAYLESKR